MDKLYIVILNLLRWGVCYPYGNKHTKQAVYAVAPHTSYWDGFYGKLVLGVLEIKYITMSADWLFYWPLVYIMKFCLHAFPVSKTKHMLKYLHEHDDTNFVICPEGQLKATNKWPNGYYRIAKKLNIPIIPVAFDYKNRTVFIGNEYSTTLLTEKEIKHNIQEFYKRFGSAKHPECFSADTE